jgi:hypothetical protein
MDVRNGAGGRALDDSGRRWELSESFDATQQKAQSHCSENYLKKMQKLSLMKKVNHKMG